MVSVGKNLIDGLVEMNTQHMRAYRSSVLIWPIFFSSLSKLSALTIGCHWDQYFEAQPVADLARGNWITSEFSIIRSVSMPSVEITS
ncbi:MAG: hypothetical protein ABSH01_27050 [Terriglobia bacterium]|jgi:hypothetical protein